ncbi:MAG: hypothetical protein GY947_19350 [Rhodobacteraceae bacterium]|nr:hypothetical protein [Paracoccaceae bacterium]
MIRNFFFGLVLLCAIINTSSAQTDDRLRLATRLWLEGDDKQSLPMLADLARAGNSDARLLLGRIETTDFGLSPYRVSLGPTLSRSLFRAKNSRPFGQTWLAVEASLGNELAQALTEIGRPTPNPGLIERLSRLGEQEATDHPTRVVALYGSREMKRKLITNLNISPDLKPYIAYLSDPPEPRGDGLSALRHIAPHFRETVSADDPDTLGMAGVMALGFGFGDHSEVNRWRPVVENWLLSAPSTKPIANLCQNRCKQERAGCAFAFFTLSGGYYETIRFDSPLEKVIPQSRFLDSRRAQLMVLRRAVLARTETNLAWLAEPSRVSSLSQCAADIIGEERLKYQ